MLTSQLAHGRQPPDAKSEGQPSASKPEIKSEDVASEITSDFDWQSSLSLQESNAYMLEHQLSFDVIFDVGNGDGRKEIGAHKYVLMSRSCVFYEMFRSHPTEKRVVRVEDIDAAIFKGMLKYVYTEHVIFELESAFPLLHAAKKYELRKLTEKCEAYLTDVMAPNNACEILEGAHRFNESKLSEKAFRQILNYGDASLQSTHFKDLCDDCVKKIISDDDLVVTNEEVVLEALKNRTGSVAGDDGSALREALGELIHLIRFPLMSATYFRDSVMHTGLLSSTEENGVLEQYMFPGCRKMFSSEIRKVKNKAIEVWRLPQQLKLQADNRHPKLKRYDGKATDAIAFVPSRNVLLHGFMIWTGSRALYKFSYSLHCVFETKHDLICKRKHWVEAEDEFRVVELPFIVQLNRWMKYVIELTIEDNVSCYSTHNYWISNCFECQFEGGSIIFTSSDRDTNGTTPHTGQIPCLICSVP